MHLASCREENACRDVSGESSVGVHWGPGPGHKEEMTDPRGQVGCKCPGQCGRWPVTGTLSDLQSLSLCPRSVRMGGLPSRGQEEPEESVRCRPSPPEKQRECPEWPWSPGVGGSVASVLDLSPVGLCRVPSRANPHGCTKGLLRAQRLGTSQLELIPALGHLQGHASEVLPTVLWWTW